MESFLYDEAIAVYLSRKVPDPGANFAVGVTYGLAGRKEEARKVLAKLLEKRMNYPRGRRIPDFPGAR